jgi:BarA-like signal transduction histidine kinase
MIFFIPNIAPSKVTLRITKSALPKESFDYAQLDKEVPFSLQLSTQELKLELDVLMD